MRGTTSTGGSAVAGGNSTGATTGRLVSGTLTGATWTADGSPYILVADIRVVSLTIQPGVVVQSRGDFAFEVDGAIVARGTKANPITFSTTADNAVGWEGIRFNSAQSTDLSHLAIHHALNSGIRIADTSVGLDNVSIANNQSNQGGGVYVSGTLSTVTITNSLIVGNVASNVFEAGGGVFVRDGASVDIRNTIISGNSTVYANARGGGVFLCGGTLSMSNDVIVGNGFATYGNGSGGIAINTGGLTNCTGGSLTLDSSIVFNNVSFQITGSGATVSYSDVQGGYTGTSNISDNPLFADTDFHLVAGASPCIDTGNLGSASNDGCLPPALGASRNDMGAYGGPLACMW